MLKKIKIFVNCKLFRAHNWTCDAMENIPPTQEQINSGSKGFWNYAEMYCKDCGEKSKIRISRP